VRHRAPKPENAQIDVPQPGDGKLAVSWLRGIVTPLSERQAVSTSMVTGTLLVMMS
jgi:hypothetical protein